MITALHEARYFRLRSLAGRAMWRYLAGVLRILPILLFIVSGSFAGLAQASAFGFILSSPDIELKDPQRPYVDGQMQPVSYEVRRQIGEPFTLQVVGQMYARPRGAEASAPRPYAPQAHSWLFDDEMLQIRAPENQEYGTNTRVIRLNPVKAGKTRVRFVGLIAGYEVKYDIYLTICDQ